MSLSGRLRRPGLRSRATAAFALGAALVAGVLAGATYGIVHHYLLAQRVSSVENEAFSDARVVKETLAASPNSPVSGSLSSVMPGKGTRSLVYRDGTWYSTSVNVGNQNLPTSLVDQVLSGNPAIQRTLIAGTPMLAIGMPVPAVSADYFEIHSLADLQTTFDILGLVLVLGAASITMGGALVGRWASGHLVQPLRGVTAVAAEIGAGDLTRRLPTTADRDLDPLVTSFNDMVTSLHERIERDARFTSDVSHELRSPLTAVQASVELLALFRGFLPPEGTRALGLVEQETSRFSETLENLLEISRMDAGAADLILEELQIGELVENAVSSYPHGPVPVVADAPASVTVIHCDRRRMQSVLTNLLDNARIHGGGATSVSIATLDHRATITVEDAGPGVPAGERSKIFERFYRGRTATRRNEQTGSGLGLALVAENVRAHNGRVWVEDRTGGGSRFVVSLPFGSDIADAGPGSPAEGGHR